MEYGKIIAVTGLPGLFELLNSKNDGAIVRSLDDKTTRFISSRVHNFSHLESIEVFTVRDNVNLIDIFNAMDKEEGKIPDGKDAAALKKYFEKVYSDLDFERVYTSDLKKMVKWYEILKKNKIEIKLTEAPAEAEEDQPEEALVAEKKKATSAQGGPKADEGGKASAAEARTTTVEKKPAVKAKAEEKPAAEVSAGKPAAKKKAEPKEKPAPAQRVPKSDEGVKATAGKDADALAKEAKKAAAKKAAPKKKS